MKKEKYTAKVSSYEMPAGLLMFPADVEQPSRWGVLNDPETEQRPSSTNTAATFNYWPGIRYEVPVEQRSLSYYNRTEPYIFLSIGETRFSPEAFVNPYPYNVDWDLDVRSNEQTYVHMKAKAITFARMLIHGGFKHDESYRSLPEFNLKVPNRLRNAIEIKRGDTLSNGSVVISDLIKIPGSKKIYYLVYGPYLMVIDCAIAGQYYTKNGGLNIFNFCGYVQLKLFNRLSGDVLYEPEAACFDSTGRGLGQLYLTHYKSGLVQKVSVYDDYENIPGEPNMLGLITLKSRILPAGNHTILTWFATNDVIMQHSFLTFENRDWHCYFENGNYQKIKFGGITRLILYRDLNEKNWRIEKFLKTCTYYPSTKTDTLDYKRYDYPPTGEHHHANIYPFPSFGVSPKILLVPVIFENGHLYPEFYHVNYDRRSRYGTSDQPVGIFKADDRYYLFVHRHLAIRMDSDYIPGDEATEDDIDDGKWELVGTSKIDTISGISKDAIAIRIVLRSGSIEKSYVFPVDSSSNEQVITVDFYERSYTFTLSGGQITLTDKSWKIDEWAVWQLLTYEDQTSKDKRDKSALQKLIQYVKNNIESADHYKQKYYDLYINALTNAETVLNNESASQTSIDSAYNNLEMAYNNLYDIYGIKEALSRRVNYSEDDYSKYSYGRYIAACDDAENAISDDNYNVVSEDVLNSILDAENSLVYIVELISKISYYENLPLQSTDYTVVSWMAYENSINDAKNLVAFTNDYSDDDVSNAILAMDSAYGELEEMSGPLYNYDYVANVMSKTVDAGFSIPEGATSFDVPLTVYSDLSNYNDIYRFLLWYSDEDEEDYSSRDPDEMYSIWGGGREHFRKLYGETLYGTYGQNMADYYWDQPNGYSGMWEKMTAWNNKQSNGCIDELSLTKTTAATLPKKVFVKIMDHSPSGVCLATETNYQNYNGYSIKNNYTRPISPNTLYRMYFWINRATTGWANETRQPCDFFIDIITADLPYDSFKWANINLFESDSRYTVMPENGKNKSYFKETFSRFLVTLNRDVTPRMDYFQFTFNTAFRFKAVIVAIAKLNN